MNETMNTTNADTRIKPAIDLNKYKLVKIGWADAIENLDGWHTEEEALKWADDDDWIVHQLAR